MACTHVLLRQLRIPNTAEAHIQLVQKYMHPVLPSDFGDNNVDDFWHRDDQNDAEYDFLKIIYHTYFSEKLYVKNLVSSITSAYPH